MTDDKCDTLRAHIKIKAESKISTALIQLHKNITSLYNRDSVLTEIDFYTEQTCRKVKHKKE